MNEGGSSRPPFFIAFSENFEVRQIAKLKICNSADSNELTEIGVRVLKDQNQSGHPDKASPHHIQRCGV